MFANGQPGCWGAADRLPKKPGPQKLTPPSSANAQWEKIVIAEAKMPAAMPSRWTAIGRWLVASSPPEGMLPVIWAPLESSLSDNFGVLKHPMPAADRSLQESNFRGKTWTLRPKSHKRYRFEARSS